MYVAQAVNSAGAGPFSNVSWSQTPVSSPAAVSSVRATSTPRSIHLVWKEPVSNGSRILSYNIDIGDQRPLFPVDADTLEYDILDLMPETTYKSVMLLYACFPEFCTPHGGLYQLLWCTCHSVFFALIMTVHILFD